jgi:hypothetical protein
VWYIWGTIQAYRVLSEKLEGESPTLEASAEMGNNIKM